MTARRRKFSDSVLLDVLIRQRFRCACCGETLGHDPAGWHYDHAIPLSLGGEDTPENLRALLVKHHIRKSIRELKDRAKMERIRKQDGLRAPRKTAQQKRMAKMLERGT